MRPLPDHPRLPDPVSPVPDPDALAALGDVELLALLIGRSSTVQGGSSAAISLFSHFGDLAAIASADVSLLVRVGGLGPSALTQLKLMRLLSERLVRAQAARRPVITTWSALLAYVKVALAEQPREQFRVLFLDRRNQLMRDELVAHGTVDHAPVYPREVVRRALELSASAVILVHNHPSGDAAPSRADIEMTRRVIEAAAVFGIDIHDHLVVGRDGTASMRSLGLLT